MLFWILFSCLALASLGDPKACRRYNTVLTVPNGGQWGEWAARDSCVGGHAYGFAVQVQEPQGSYDDTALNGIRLECSDGGVIESSVASWGAWTEYQYCPDHNDNKSYFIAFSLKVEAPGSGDETAANNIKFKCSDGTILMHEGGRWGEFGPWSNDCTSGFISAIQTKVHNTGFYQDYTALNDVRFYCSA